MHCYNSHYLHKMDVKSKVKIQIQHLSGFRFMCSLIREKPGYSLIYSRLILFNENAVRARFQSLYIVQGSRFQSFAITNMAVWACTLGRTTFALTLGGMGESMTFRKMPSCVAMSTHPVMFNMEMYGAGYRPKESLAPRWWLNWAYREHSEYNKWSLTNYGTLK